MEDFLNSKKVSDIIFSRNLTIKCHLQLQGTDKF
jgi:hypothetical protein